MNSTNMLAILEVGSVAYARYTRPTIERYAEATDSELFVISERWPIYGRNFCANKFQAIHAFLEGGFERLLYLDLDVLVAPHAENIFEAHDGGFWAAPAPGPPQKRRYLRNLKKHFGEVPAGLDIESYPNGGVFLLDRPSASRLLAGLAPPFFCDDQGIMHWSAHRMGLPIHPLSYRWNCVLRTLSVVEDPCFLHLAGNKRKLGFAERYRRACELNPAVASWGYSIG